MQDERRLRQQGDVDLDNRSVFKALPHGAAPSDSKSTAIISVTQGEDQGLVQDVQEQ